MMEDSSHPAPGSMSHTIEFEDGVRADLESLGYAVGLPAVFVPLPHAVDDHQTANARYLSDVGAALLCPQATLTPEVLVEQLRPLLNRERLLVMAQKSRMQAKPDATTAVVNAVVSL